MRYSIINLTKNGNVTSVSRTKLYVIGKIGDTNGWGKCLECNLVGQTFSKVDLIWTKIVIECYLESTIFGYGINDFGPSHFELVLW